MVAAVVTWFSGVRGASLKLPNGWFGRPYDNLHQLTGARVSGDALVLVLDERQELSISSPESLRLEPKSLSFVGAKRIVWRWDEYGSNESHVESFVGGELEFHAP